MNEESAPLADTEPPAGPVAEVEIEEFDLDDIEVIESKVFG